MLCSLSDRWQLLHNFVCTAECIKWRLHTPKHHVNAEKWWFHFPAHFHLHNRTNSLSVFTQPLLRFIFTFRFYLAYAFNHWPCIGRSQCNFMHISDKQKHSQRFHPRFCKWHRCSDAVIQWDRDRVYTRRVSREARAAFDMRFLNCIQSICCKQGDNARLDIQHDKQEVTTATTSIYSYANVVFWLSSLLMHYRYVWKGPMALTCGQFSNL